VPLCSDLRRVQGVDVRMCGSFALAFSAPPIAVRTHTSHLPFRRRERAMLRFRRMRSLRKFASVHASAINHFSRESSLSSRPLSKQKRAAALAKWRGLCSA